MSATMSSVPAPIVMCLVDVRASPELREITPKPVDISVPRTLWSAADKGNEQSTRELLSIVAENNRQFITAAEALGVKELTLRLVRGSIGLAAWFEAKTDTDKV